MKYIVDVNGERLEVELDADGVRVEGEHVRAHLADVSGTPIHLVTIGNEQHRVAARRGEARGEYVLWMDGYRYTVENSIYLGQAATGKGLGKALLEALIEECQALGIREMVAVISDKGAEASVALHERFGFVEVGRMGRVGFKFGRWLGTIYLQKSLKPAKRRGLFGRPSS